MRAALTYKTAETVQQKAELLRCKLQTAGFSEGFATVTKIFGHEKCVPWWSGNDEAGKGTTWGRLLYIT